MKNLFKKKSVDKADNISRTETEQINDELLEEEEFENFFEEVLKKFPEKSADTIVKAYDKSRVHAEKILSKSKNQFERIFDEFLEGVDNDIRKKCHSTIHAAGLTAAIIGCSPIPFSDAVLLVPVQLTMMARLHKLFDLSWSENLGTALSRELIVVGLGRSAVGNLLKFIPTVGTVAGAAINGAVASTITEALGWVTVKMLNDGDDIFDDVMSFKNQFNLLFDSLNSSTQNSKK